MWPTFMIAERDNQSSLPLASPLHKAGAAAPRVTRAAALALSRPLIQAAEPRARAAPAAGTPRPAAAGASGAWMKPGSRFRRADGFPAPSDSSRSCSWGLLFFAARGLGLR